VPCRPASHHSVSRHHGRLVSFGQASSIVPLSGTLQLRGAVGVVGIGSVLSAIALLHAKRTSNSNRISKRISNSEKIQKKYI